MIPSLFLLLTLITCYVDADTPTLIINPSQTKHAIAETLWGVFFEEINHAGQGGLYSEMISNRNFGGEDYAPWEPVGTGVGLNLDTSYPLNIHNQQALHISFNDNGDNKGVKNTGFWGIPIKSGTDYTLSFYIIASKSCTLDILLLNNDGSNIYYQSSIHVDQASITPDQVILDTHSIAVAPWKKFNFPINVNFSDPNCQFQIIMNNPNSGMGAELWLDMVSFQPTQGWKGLPYIRSDLAEHVVALAPAFVRFPGGCYSEGDRLGDRFEWKKALGPIETRPGHWDLWNYWSEDGLGLYEYLCFIEQLNSRPIWVVNSGNSHVEQIDTINIQPWIQDALDSLEFAMGDVSTKWGSQRAAMGHPAPFNIYAVSIGNEDCGKNFYVTNYGAFYAALTKYYPHIRLIANCDLTTANPPQPVQLWDYHVYQSPEWFFQNQHEFDKYPRVSAHIFQSEYAVTQKAGQGNLIAAVAEATWMIGLERNSDLVDLASYAPLFVNTHDRYWNPDAIVFNSSASFGTPSYWTQYMFSRANDFTIAGQEYLVTSSWSIDGSHLFAQSASIAPVAPGSYDNTTTHLLIIKLVNYNNKANNIIIDLPFASYSISNDQIEWRTMTSGNPNDENSLQQPNHIIPKDTIGMLRSSNTSYVFQASMPANSIHILRIQLSLANDDDVIHHIDALIANDDDVIVTPY